jgi:DNA-binding CsgD family transcriptional regulator
VESKLFAEARAAAPDGRGAIEMDGETTPGRDERVRPKQTVHLSPRQCQVLPLVADGLTTDEIADVLGISPRTVRMHCDTLKLKLGVQHRRQLIHVYRELVGLRLLSSPE